MSETFEPRSDGVLKYKSSNKDNTDDVTLQIYHTSERSDSSLDIDSSQVLLLVGLETKHGFHTVDIY